jgi:hypothetical protein
MSPEIGKAAFTLALFIVVPAVILLPLTQPGSAEFVVTLMALGVGLLFLAVVIFFVRRALH